MAVLLSLLGGALLMTGTLSAVASALLVAAAVLVAVAAAGGFVLLLWIERDQLVLLREQRMRSQAAAAALSPAGTIDARIRAIEDAITQRHEQGLALWRRASTELLGEVLEVKQATTDLRSELQDQAQNFDEVRGLRARLDSLYSQLEALSHLTTILGDEPPLPPLRGWALSPDAALHLVLTVMERRPSMTVEVGSGASSVLLGRAVRKLGEGRVMALEHDEEFANQTRRLIASHGLTEWVDVVSSPLIEHTVAGSTYHWYDTTALTELTDPIDVLLVDGPPTTTGPLARLPALPLLRNSLAKDAVVILDDTARPDEQEVVIRWQAIYPEATVRTLDHEKGTVEFRFGAAHE